MSRTPEPTAPGLAEPLPSRTVDRPAATSARAGARSKPARHRVRDRSLDRDARYLPPFGFPNTESEPASAHGGIIGVGDHRDPINWLGMRRRSGYVSRRRARKAPMTNWTGLWILLPLSAGSSGRQDSVLSTAAGRSKAETTEVRSR